MKKVININFQGRVIPIEDTAYEILKQYIDSLSRFFANEEGKDEIINDIEGRIAELFTEVLKKGSTCITDTDVQGIISSIGRPEDFEADDTTFTGASSTTGTTNTQSNTNSAEAETEYIHSSRHERLYRDENNKLLGGICAGLANYFGIDKIVVRILFIVFALGFGFGFIVYLILWVAIPSTASTKIGSVRKRLFRDPESKLIAGVCGGLASYFGVNVWIPRLLFLIPFLSFVTSWHHWGVFDFPNFLNISFSPGAILIYIILWLIIPEAATTSDRLEMKGEKVDLNSIKNTIQKDMEGFGERAKDFGKEVGERATKFGNEFGKRGKQFSGEAAQVVRKSGTTLGDVITIIFKIFAYFIVGVVLLAIVGSLFGIGIAVTGMLPLKAYIISDGWQNLLAWGTYIFFIWVPVIGIITFIIRRITKSRSNSSVMRFGFGALWILGLFCFIGLIASVRNDFSYHNSPAENTIQLDSLNIDKLEVRFDKNNRYYFNSSFFHFEPFATVDEDTAIVRNIHLRILKSDNSKFHVTLLKLAYGSSRQLAENRAANISYNIRQEDSTLYFDKGIPINKNDKFRNQSVYTTIYVPVGKRIIVKDDVGWGNDVHFDFGGDYNDWDWRDDNGYSWNRDIEYVMTENGLKNVYPDANNDNNNNDNNGTDEDKTNQDDNQQPNAAPPDSSHYHYKPSKKATDTPSPVKSTKVVNNNLETSAKITDIGSAFIQRFTL